MDKETKDEFTAVREQFERLTIMVAEGFSDVHKRIDFVHSSLKTEITEMRIEFKADIAELRDEIRSIRAEIVKIPDDIDATYSKTINDLLDRVTALELRIKKLEPARS